MKLKKLATSLLIVAMITTSLCGCQNSGNKDEANNQQQSSNSEIDETTNGQGKGRFLESEVAFPEGIDQIITSRKLENGKIEVVGKNSQMEEFYILRSDDQGNNWESTKVEDLNHDYISSIAIAADGGVAFCGFFRDSVNAQMTNIKLANADGAITAVNLIMPELEGMDYQNQIIQAVYDGNGNLIISDLMRTIYFVDTQSGNCKKFSDVIDEDMDYFGIVGDTLYAVSPEARMQLYSTVDGSAKDQDAVLDELAMSMTESIVTPGYYPMVFTAGEEEGSSIYANHDGVFYHKAGGSVSEQLINGELTSLGDSSIMLESVIQLNGTTFFLLIADSMGNTRLLKYQYDETVSTIPEKMLKVYALEDSAVLQHAIVAYQKLNPDVFVKKEIGLGGSSGITVEDALQALSTNILAGNGPDVLILDGIPVDSYIEKGILADISSIVDEIDQTDGIFENIKNMYRTDGKTYCFPARFLFSVIEGSPDAVVAGNKIESLAKYAKDLKEQDPKTNILPSNGAQGMLLEIMDVDSSSWQKEDGQVEKEKLENFLRCVKELYTIDSYSEDQINNSAYVMSKFVGGEKIGTINISSIGRLSNMYQVAFGTMSSMNDYASLIASEKQKEGTYDLFNKENSKSMIPYQLLGVAENSNDKENALDFIRTMLGNECESVAGNGFPTNRAAFEIQRENQNEYSLYSMSEDGVGIQMEVKTPTDAEYDTLVQMVESLETPTLSDRIIRELILSEGMKYLNDEQTLENAVTTIMQKVTIYFSE